MSVNIINIIATCLCLLSSRGNGLNPFKPNGLTLPILISRTNPYIILGVLGVPPPPLLFRILPMSHKKATKLIWVNNNFDIAYNLLTSFGTSWVILHAFKLTVD